MTTRPKIVCLCGSARFQEQFQTSYLQETLAGHIVLSIALTPGGEDSLLAGLVTQEKEKLKARFDALHRHKIDLADEILILNVGDISVRAPLTNLPTPEREANGSDS